MDPSFVSVNVDMSPDVAATIGTVIIIAATAAIGYLFIKHVSRVIRRELHEPRLAV